MVADCDKNVFYNGSTEYDTVVQVTSGWLAWDRLLTYHINCIRGKDSRPPSVKFHSQICALFWQLEIANRPTSRDHTSPVAGKIGLLFSCSLLLYNNTLLNGHI